MKKEDQVFEVYKELLGANILVGTPHSYEDIFQMAEFAASEFERMMAGRNTNG